MKDSASSYPADPFGIPSALPLESIPAPPEGLDRNLSRLESLIESLEVLYEDKADTGDTVLGELAQVLQADAAGLYLTPGPGRPLVLLTSYRFPKSAPDRLKVDLLSGRKGSAYPMAQVYIPDVRDSVWAEAAQEGGWQRVMVYSLPRCPARLVLAYAGGTPALPTDLLRLALQALSLALRYRQALLQVSLLSQRSFELDQLLMAGIDNVREGVILLDSEGRVITCNLAGGELLGYKPDEITGLPADAVLVSRGDVDQRVQGVLKGLSATEELQVTLYDRYGGPVPVRMRVVPLRMPDRAYPYGAMAFLSDRRQEPMEKVEKDLRQQNAQLERMVSILAHEIRNPLGSIKAGLDYLEPALREDPSAHDDLKTIQSEIRRMDRLLEDALLVSRPTELQTSPQLISELVDSLLAGRAKLLAERGIIVRKDYQADLPQSMIDRVQMEQVFDNLIVNAIHAMPGGGQLTVAIEVCLQPTGSLNRVKRALRIKVSDSGVGIPTELQERIFDPFFTTKQDGTGLGLAVARRIVGQHNGTLQVESWPDIGTIFTITLPIEEMRRV